MTASTALVNDTLVAVTALPGAMFWRANSGMAVTRSRQVVRMNVTGTPDILGAFRGRPVGIECKYGSGRLSDSQKAFRAKWVEAGGVYIEGRAIDQILAELTAIANG